MSSKRKRPRSSRGPRTRSGWRDTQAAATREHLVRTARRRFGSRGYAGTPLEALVAEAGLTRGAVYHHFRDKRELFEEVLHTVLYDLVTDVERQAMLRAYAHGEERASDTVELLLEQLGRADTHHIVCIDGPAVLGHARWRARLGRGLLRPLRRALETGASRTGLSPSQLEPAAHLLFGALQEAALMQSDPATHAELGSALDWLIGRAFGETLGAATHPRWGRST